MANSAAEKLQEQLAQGAWQSAIGALQALGPGPATDFMMGLPFEQQRSLFRKLPLDLAVQWVAHFPYYHAFVLLHSRSSVDLRAIVEGMNSADRDRFFDELPEEAWQFLMDEIGGSGWLAGGGRDANASSGRGRAGHRAATRGIYYRGTGD